MPVVLERADAATMMAALEQAAGPLAFNRLLAVQGPILIFQINSDLAASCLKLKQHVRAMLKDPRPRMARWEGGPYLMLRASQWQGARCSGRM